MSTKSSRKERIGWYFIDFANSAFSTTVITVFLGPYITSIAENAADSGGNISMLFMEVASGSYFPFIVSISVLLQVFILPIVGALADSTKYKKHLLFATSYTGALATISLYFLQGTNYLMGGALFVTANIAFGASCMLYNSYLSHIAAPGERDSVSSIGWAWGYIGGGMLLILNLILYSKAALLGISDGMAVRICLSSAGIWWAIFLIIPLFTLRNAVPGHSVAASGSLLSREFKILWNNIKDARNYPQTLIFLAAYMFYNDGVQAIIALASQFGSKELGLDMSVLLTTILIVQFVAFFGAIIFNLIAKVLTSLTTLKITILVWIGVVIFAFFFLNTEFDFYLLGCVIGLVLGGTQALSRSIYSQLIPVGREAEYFSIYELSEKGTSWMGPLAFGLVYNFTGSYRWAIVSLLFFFVIGFSLLIVFNFNKSKPHGFMNKYSEN